MLIDHDKISFTKDFDFGGHKEASPKPGQSV